MSPRTLIALGFLIGGLVAALPAILLSSGGGPPTAWALQMCLPGPSAAFVFGYLLAPKLESFRSNGNRIGGANVGIRVAFCAWVVHAVLIAVPLNHEPGSEFDWGEQFVRSLSASLLISAVAIPIVCLIGGAIGLFVVSRGRNPDNRS